ncbi:MAG: hypothetical protein L6455_05270, partial [Kiritimatiellae bacterium]|nr:hypothetical protein [Kiritimatiellia bacterium]
LFRVISRATIMMLAVICGLAVSAGAAEMYHTNRTFKPVKFNLQGTPTVDQLYNESGRLTDIVKGTNITINTNETYAIEKQAVALGYASATDAWTAALNYTNGTPSNYPGKIYDNVGWVRGTKSVGAKWGAYLSTVQNRIVFKSSETNWWVSPSNGVRVAISNVLVGSLGDYPPMTETNDIGPSINTNFPGENQGESKEFYVDITNVYYQLIIPSIWITPRTAYAAAEGSNVEYEVAGSNLSQGVTWTISPTNFTGRATIQPSNDWHYAGVTPGTVATNYKVRATSIDNTNFYDEVNLGVLKVDIVESNIYVGVTNTATFHLTSDSSTNVQWGITPTVQGGASIVGPTLGTSIVVNAGAVGTNYTIIASAVNLTNCYDTCTVTAIKVELTNMTFAMGWNLTRDTGGEYPSPHWTVTNSSPYLYTRDTQVNVTATFKVEPSNFTGNITLSADGPGNLDFTNITVSVSGGLATYPAINSIGILTNYVDFWNPMQINWKYGINESPSHAAGTSSNMIYVCLASPTNVPTLYHTIVHLACSVGHATSEAGAISNSWSQLMGHNFTTWDGRTLYYYRDGTGWNSPYTISDLLVNSNGNCVAWRNLFRHALVINGVASDRIYVATTGPTNDCFVVGDWTFGTASFTNTPPYNWALQFSGSDFDMVPRPTGDVYGDITSLNTIQGQNTAPPSEKVFGNHRMARYNGTYYDPSYGTTYTSLSNCMDTVIDGYGFQRSGDSTNPLVFRVKSSSGVYEIGEVENHTNDYHDGVP